MDARKGQLTLISAEVEEQREKSFRWRGRTEGGGAYFQDPVHELAVLAGVRLVDTLIRAHNRGDLCLNGLREGPQVDFVHCSVVNVGRRRGRGRSTTTERVVSHRRRAAEERTGEEGRTGRTGEAGRRGEERRRGEEGRGNWQTRKRREGSTHRKNSCSFAM